MDTNQAFDTAAETPAEVQSMQGAPSADRYGDVALGVECAWPVMAMAD